MSLSSNNLKGNQMKRVVVLLFCLFSVFSVQAASLGVKGLDLNMTKQEVNEKRLDEKKLTIGGVEAKYVADIDYLEGKVSHVLMFFPADSYEQVKTALSSKYKLRCTHSVIQNRMGAKYQQEDCEVLIPGQILTLNRYINLESSALNYATTKFINKTREEQRKKESDI
jgi:hypothetical protein